MDYHYTWEWARYFEPLVGWLHDIGFFSFYIHLPVDSLLGAVLFIGVYGRIRRQGFLETQKKSSWYFWHAVYFGVSWLALTSFGVGLKTMIVEELDYQERKWFEPYLAPTHLYISSACLAYLALIIRAKPRPVDWFLALYVQVALVAGYAVSGYRIVGEDMEGAIGGVLLFLFFAVCNYDLMRRIRRDLSAKRPIETNVAA